MGARCGGPPPDLPGSLAEPRQQDRVRLRAAREAVAHARGRETEPDRPGRGAEADDRVADVRREDVDLEAGARADRAALADPRRDAVAVDAQRLHGDEGFGVWL